VRKIAFPKIGQRVLATHWLGNDPHDPWYIGFIESYTVDMSGVSIKIMGSNRLWRHCYRISEKEYQEWVKF